MITYSRLGHHGQLGNQMFQYSMLLGVAAKKDFQVKIPKNEKKKKKAGLCELKHFYISCGRLERTDVRHIENQYKEKGFALDPGVWDQPDWTDYTGYFQTEKYFEHCQDLVKQEFRFHEPIDKFARMYVDNNRIGNNSIVAVHVRRGDYLQGPHYFQILNKEYYMEALDDHRLPQERQLFVFSDDLTWCRENITGNNITYVESPSHWHDMAIMTYCDAYIISASSFSWWGSYLCHTPNPVVIAPYPWFPIDGPRGHYDFSDIIPDRWFTKEAKCELMP